MVEFHKMQDIPERDRDLSGNLLDTSITVLVFDAHSEHMSEFGYYDFELEQWVHFGDFSMQLVCWCKIPDPSKFIKANKPTIVLHKGYRP